MLTCATEGHKACRLPNIIRPMNFLTTLLKLCVRKARPEELPYSQTSAILLTFVYSSISVFSLVRLDAFSNPAVNGICIAATQILGLFLLLRAFSKANRFVQTLSALIGTSIIINVISAVLLALAPIPLLRGFLLFWHCYIPTLILKSALDIQAAIAFFSYLGIVFFSFILTAIFFSDFMPELETWLEAVNQQAQQQTSTNAAN